MTETLNDVLRRTAQDLPVPPAPAYAILAEGRARGRRRRTALAGAVTCFAVLVAALAVDAFPRRPHQDQGASTPSRVATTYAGATFAIGTTVYSDDGRLRVTVPGGRVFALFYTSAGVVAGTQPGHGRPDGYHLVGPDSQVASLPEVPVGSVPATDPHQPYLAYAASRDGSVRVTVVDVRDGSVVAKVPVYDDPGPTGGTPSVALDGDTIYLGIDDEVTRAVDWRTGAVSLTTVVRAGFPYVRGGVTPARVDGRPTLVDAGTGVTVLPLAEQPVGRTAVGLAPDGRYATTSGTGEFGGGQSIPVHDVHTGATTYVSLGSMWGWGPDDTLFSLSNDGVRTCSPDTGRCRVTSLQVPAVDTPPLPILGGLTYTSSPHGTP